MQAQRKAQHQSSLAKAAKCVITGLSTVETGALGEYNFYANTGKADTSLHPLSFRAYFKGKQDQKRNQLNKKTQQCLNLLICLINNIIKSNGKHKQQTKQSCSLVLPSLGQTDPSLLLHQLSCSLRLNLGSKGTFIYFCLTSQLNHFKTTQLTSE